MLPGLWLSWLQPCSWKNNNWKPFRDEISMFIDHWAKLWRPGSDFKSLYKSKNLSLFRCRINLLVEFQWPQVNKLNWWTGREKVGKRTDGIQVVGNAKKCPQKNKEMSISLMLDNIIKAAFSVFIWHKNNTCKSSLKVTVCEKSLFKKQPGSSCPQSSLLHSYKASAPNSNSQSEPSACAGQQGSVVEKRHEKPELQQKHHVTGNQQLK